MRQHSSHWIPRTYPLPPFFPICASYAKVYESRKRIFIVIHRALDEVFRSWSHVAALRALLDTSSGFTGNEVARVSGMQPRSALRALSALEELGIVRRQRGGRDHIFTLNREHVLVCDALLPLYHSERQLPEVVKTAIAEILKGSVMSAVMFGSVAKAEETPQSDLDLCCVVKTNREKEIVRTRLDAESDMLYQKFGVKVAPVIFTVDEIRKKGRTLLVRDILAHGKLIAGKPFKGLLHG